MKKKKSLNKKVINATPTVFDNIKFRSKLEVYTYKALKENKLKAEYEPIKFELVPSFQFKDKKIRPMTYTPDFVGNNFIIEAKGRPNDVFPYKWKLFQYNLFKSGLDEQYHLFIVHNHKEVNECIKQIKQLTDRK